MAVVGVAKFLGCEKTLVKNPSEAVRPFLTSDRTQFFFFFSLEEVKGSVFWTAKCHYRYKEEEAMGAEEEKKT